MNVKGHDAPYIVGTFVINSLSLKPRQSMWVHIQVCAKTSYREFHKNKIVLT